MWRGAVARRRAALASGLLGGVLALAGLLAWPASSWARAQELAAAERLWAQRTFGHYQLDLADKRCLQRIEVRNERVVKVAPNRCEAPPRAIGDLFALIRRDGQISQPCIYLGCVCDDVLRVQASYDAQLGYPAHILVRIRAEPNWRHPQFWQRAWRDRRLPNCDGLQEGSKLIQVMRLQPVAQR